MQFDPEAAAGVRAGDVLAGKYRVERVLGVGGMGVVVAAHHLQLDERVALKFLLPAVLANADAIARFAREARAVVKIKSEHVARVIDVGTLDTGAPYIVMEFLDGVDLHAWLRQKGPLAIEQAVEFMLQASEAIAEAHALGIIHRDLKPANLFVVRRADGLNSIKVLDFGISKLTALGSLGGDVAVTKTSAIMGSPFYMSPEQMKSSKDVDVQADVWALGIILYELLSGKPPFFGDTFAEVCTKIAIDTPLPLRSLRPDAPARLEAVLRKCLEKVRSKRYQNVAQLARALLEFAPERARGSVDRISRIIQTAGLSPSVLEAPSSPNPTNASHPTQTIPPLGRTTQGTKGGKKVVVAVVAVACAVGIAATIGFSVARRGAPVLRDVAMAPSAPAQPASPPSSASAVADAASLAVTASSEEGASGNPQPVGSVTSALRSMPVPIHRTITPRTSLVPSTTSRAPSSPSSPSAGASAHAAFPQATAMANCDPPYYFDAKGTRVFKKECF